MTPPLSALFVNYDSWSECVDAVLSLLEHGPEGTQVIVVDNASPTRSPDHELILRETCEKTRGTLILHDENGGYSKGMNLAYRHATSDFILVCNPDLVFHAGTVPRMLDALRNDDTVGASAPEGYWDTGLECKLPKSFMPTLRSEWLTTWAHLRPASLEKLDDARIRASIDHWIADGPLDLPMFSGCCFMMPRRVIDEIGFFDERFPLYYEDSDLSRRILASGRRIVQPADCRLTHLYNRSGEKDYPAAMRRHAVSKPRYFGKYYGMRGRTLVWTCRRLLESSWGRTRLERFKPGTFDDVETRDGRPVFHLPPADGRLVLEHSLDPWFFHPGAVCPTGESWSPGDALFARYPEEIWFRLLAVTASEFRVLASYRFLRSPSADGRQASA